MPSLKRKFGDAGEKIAEKYLIDKGYKILEKNFQRRWGEIDIIAMIKKVIVFIEVKTRDAVFVSWYPPEASVNYVKQMRLNKICTTYLCQKNYDAEQEWQLDVLAIAIDKITKKARIRHIENILRAKY